MKSLVWSGLAVLLATAVVARGELVARYALDGDGADSEGAADGEVGIAVEFGDGVDGQAAVFGVGGAFGVGTISVVEAFDPGAGDFSIAFWVKRTQVDTANADGVFDALNNVGTGYQANFRTVPDADQMAFRLDDNRGQFVLLIDPEPTADLEWHHFALTVDRAADEAVLYRDGAVAGFYDISVLTGAISPDRPLEIGGLNDNQTLGLDGLLDELRFYDHVLAAAEVEALAAGGDDGPRLAVTGIERDPVLGEWAITWNAQDGSTYAVEVSANLEVWETKATGVRGGRWEDQEGEVGGVRYYRVVRER